MRLHRLLAMKFRIVSPHDQQLAQVLHRRAVEGAADSVQKRLAFAALVVGDADLDQLVRLQRDVDFVQHGAGQSLHADREHRT